MDGTLAYVQKGQGLKHRLAWWSPDGTLVPIGREHDERINSVHLSRGSDSIVYATGSGLTNMGV